MPLVTVKIDHKTFQLQCDAGLENRISDLATSVNQQVLTLKSTSPNAPLELLLLMAAMNLQDKVQALRQEVIVPEDAQKNLLNNEGEKLAETLSTIASYLENLAKKIGK